MLDIENLEYCVGSFGISNLNFKVPDGSYTVILGPSGSGKSLLIELIAGIIQPHNGMIRIAGRNVTRLRPGTRGAGIVFQDYALFPHLTVKENILFSKTEGLTRIEKTERMTDIAGALSITGLLNRRIGGLSGGEKQRVALARTLMPGPGILLLDEPLTSLDMMLRREAQKLLKKINAEGQTILHVTHDPAEGAYLATHVALMNEGAILQAGCYEEVLSKPCNAFVASFLGVRNFLRLNPGKALPDRVVTSGGWTIPCNSLGRHVEARYAIIQPGQIRMLPSSDGESGHLLFTLEEINRRPGMAECVLTAPEGEEIFVHLPEDHPLPEGRTFSLSVSARDVKLLFGSMSDSDPF